MTDKIFRYFASTIGGLEEVVLADLQARLKTLKQIRVEKGSRHGRIFFTYSQSPRHLLSLRSSDGCSAVLSELNGVTVGKPGLDYVIRRLSGVDLAPALSLLNSLNLIHSQASGGDLQQQSNLADIRKFQLGVTMSGSHRFSRSELTRRAQDLLICQGMQLSSDDSSLRFQLQLQGKRAIFSLRLPVQARARTFTYRGQLDGPLAHCLGLLLGLGSDDVVVAADCAPAALAEILTAGHPHMLVGLHDVRGDIFPLRSTIREPDFHWLQTGGPWPIRDGSVDCVLGIWANGDFQGLNLHECARVLYPGAIAGVLAEYPAELVQSLEQANLPFDILASLPIYLKARKHHFLLLERLEEVTADVDLVQLEQLQ